MRSPSEPWDHGVVSGGVQLPEAGWFADPYRLALLRWWDGTTWTGHTYPAVSPVRRFLAALPWRPWAVWLAAMSTVGLIFFGLGESTSVAHSHVWYPTGFVSIAVLALLASAVTLRDRRWRDAALLSFLVACIVGIAIFLVSAPSTSRSCQNNGQPLSAGTYDCDTSYGLGGPIMVVAFFIPSFAVVGIGKAAAAVLKRPR